MQDDDMFISAEEFFGKVGGDAHCRKKMPRKGSPADDGKRFVEMKIRVAMKAHGVSREKAERLVADLAQWRSK